MCVRVDHGKATAFALCSTAFVAKTLPLACVSTAFVAKTLPFLGALRWLWNCGRSRQAGPDNARRSAAPPSHSSRYFDEDPERVSAF